MDEVNWAEELDVGRGRLSLSLLPAWFCGQATVSRDRSRHLMSGIYYLPDTLRPSGHDVVG